MIRSYRASVITRERVVEVVLVNDVLKLGIFLVIEAEESSGKVLDSISYAFVIDLEHLKYLSRLPHAIFRGRANQELPSIISRSAAIGLEEMSV